MRRQGGSRQWRGIRIAKAILQSPTIQSNFRPHISAPNPLRTLSASIHARSEPASEWTPEASPRPDVPAVAVPTPVPVPTQGGSAFPFDPQRLLGALRRRRWRVLWGTIFGLLLGAGLGMWKAKTRYEVSIELIKRYSQPTLQFGINGEPYKPRQFTAATLASAARSPNVLERVATRFGKGVSADLLKSCILVKEDRTTDFVTLTLSGYQTAEATVELAKMWTEEVIDVTREMLSEESGAIRKILQSQLTNNERELEKLDRLTLELVGNVRLLAADGQIDSFLHSQAEAEAKFDTVRQDLDAVNLKIEGVKTELQQLTPLSEELRAARVELDQFRTRYTDTNPLVMDRMEKVAALEAKLKSPAAPAGSTDVNSLTGTFVSNALYLRLIELENQRDALDRQFQNLKKRREHATESPGDSSRLMEVLQKRQTLRTAQSLLLSRMQEVRLYEENPPAFYGVFAPAEIGSVVTKGKPLKVAIYGSGGLFGGMMLSLGLIIFCGLRDPRLRTPGEAVKALGVPLLGVLTAGDSAEKSAEIGGRLWTRWIGNGGGKKARTVWAPAPGVREDDFWQMMLAEARKLLPTLVVVDCGTDSPSALADRPENADGAADPFVMVQLPIADCTLDGAKKIHEFIASLLARGDHVWVRFSGPVQEPATTLARLLEAPLVLAPLHTTEGAFWKGQAELFRHGACPPCGVLVLDERNPRS